VSTRKKPMPLDEHRNLGLALDAMYRELTQIWVWLGNEHLPKSHKAVRKLETAASRLAAARSDLENLMFDQHNGDPGATTRIYFPHHQEDWA
jgi:hypothetical protein